MAKCHVLIRNNETDEPQLCDIRFAHKKHASTTTLRSHLDRVHIGWEALPVSKGSEVWKEAQNEKKQLTIRRCFEDRVFYFLLIILFDFLLNFSINLVVCCMSVTKMQLAA